MEIDCLGVPSNLPHGSSLAMCKILLSYQIVALSKGQTCLQSPTLLGLVCHNVTDCSTSDLSLLACGELSGKVFIMMMINVGILMEQNTVTIRGR